MTDESPQCEFGTHLGGPAVGDPPVDRVAYWLDSLRLGQGALRYAFVSDHLQKQAAPMLEAWTAVAYLAAAAPSYTFGHLVLAQSYRSPALLAKMASTLHELTGGRVVLGIGAGWQEDEYLSYDFPFPKASVRIEQLGEAIDLIRTMWRDSPATYAGTHYRVSEAYCEPRPNPPPPILIGGQGPKLMRVVAEKADIWQWDGPLETFRPPLDRLVAACDDVGRDLSTIRLAAGMEVYLPYDASDFPAPSWSGYEDFMCQPFGPTPEDAIREITRLREVGVTLFIAYFWDHRSLSRFVDEVIPGV